MTDGAFTTTYGCGNCGNEWSDTHTSQTRVKRANGDVCVFDTECNMLGMNSCECCWRVVCPVCELDDEVSVADRNPVSDEDDD